MTRAYFPERGNDGYRVIGYDLALDYRVGPNRLSGVARIALTADEPLTRIVLDFGAFRISRVLVDGVAANYAHRGDKLRIIPAAPVTGACTVEIRYAGNPKPSNSHWGGLGWDQLTDGVIVASQPTGAPSWFPCDDRPSAKAPFRIAVTTASAYTVVANGILMSQTRSGANTTWVYEQPEPMAPYLASVQIGRYSSTVLAGHRIHHPEGLSARVARDFGRQGQMMTAFSRWFGPYPFGSYTVIVVDDDLEIPVEAQGMSVFGRNHVDGRRGEERMVAHELAHQWFGNSLTLGQWSDIWLHEGFAAYAEWLWWESVGAGTADEHARRWHRRLAALPQDFVLADPGQRKLFDDRVYKRGALTLHALRCEVGDETFFSSLRNWTAAHRHSNVNSLQFERHMQAATARPLDRVMRSWLRERPLPPLDLRPQ